MKRMGAAVLGSIVVLALSCSSKTREFNPPTGEGGDAGADAAGAGISGHLGSAGSAGRLGASGGAAGDTSEAGEGGRAGSAGDEQTAGGDSAGGGSAGAPVVTPKADGELCSTAGECKSGLCGGRCCPAGKPCSCPQPSGQNLLKNPGFDSNVSGWTVSSSEGTGSFHWVAVSSNDQDSTSCPYSGFGRIYSNGKTTISQCVPVSTAKAYNLTAALSNSSHGDFADEGFGELECRLDWFTGASCGGNSVVLADGEISTTWINVDWSPTELFSGGPWYPPETAVSARFSCSGICSGGAYCYTNFDHLGVVEAPASY